MRCGTFSWCVNHCVIHPWSYLPNCKLLYFNFPPLTYWTSKWLLCALFKHFQRLWGLTKSHFEDLPDHFNEQILTLSTPNRSSCQCGLTYYVIMLIAPHAYSIRAGDSATSAAYKRYLQSGWGWKLPHLFFFFFLLSASSWRLASSYGSHPWLTRSSSDIWNYLGLNCAPDVDSKHVNDIQTDAWQRACPRCCYFGALQASRHAVKSACFLISSLVLFGRTLRYTLPLRIMWLKRCWLSGSCRSIEGENLHKCRWHFLMYLFLEGQAERVRFQGVEGQPWCEGVCSQRLPKSASKWRWSVFFNSAYRLLIR